MPKSIVGKLDESNKRLIKEDYEINKTDMNLEPSEPPIGAQFCSFVFLLSDLHLSLRKTL